MKGDSIWTARLWVWLPALLFFLANAGVFAVYRMGYAGQVQSLEEDLSTATAQLERLEKDRRRREQFLARVEANSEGIAELYAERLSTRRERLTEFSIEVKRLARQAGLDPQAISYPEEQIESYGLVKRSFNFGVQGTYAELRRFINLLEESPSFLTLEGVTLAQGSQGVELRMDLELSTLFATDAAVPAVARPASAAPAGEPAPPAIPETPEEEVP